MCCPYRDSLKSEKEFLFLVNLSRFNIIIFFVRAYILNKYEWRIWKTQSYINVEYQMSTYSTSQPAEQKHKTITLIQICYCPWSNAHAPVFHMPKCSQGLIWKELVTTILQICLATKNMEILPEVDCYFWMNHPFIPFWSHIWKFKVQCIIRDLRLQFSTFGEHHN